MEENLNFWKQFDIVSLKTFVEGFMEEIRKQTERSMKSRKELASATKTFRSLSVEEKLKSLGSVLKKYQKEIDALTKRARKAEKMYVTSFRDISKAPGDVSEIVLAYETIRQEFSNLKNQDITVRKLETQVSRLKSKMETTVELRVQKLKNEIETSRNERESELLLKVKDAERLAHESAMKSDELQNRLFELQHKIDDEDLNMNSSSNETIGYSNHDASDEMKRRVQLLEAENRRLVERVTNAERTCNDEKLVTNLKESVRSEQNRVSILREKISMMESKLKSSENSLSDLRKELGSRPSVESLRLLRQKLEAFRTIEYGDDVSFEEEEEEEVVGGEKLNAWFRDLVNQKVRSLQKESAELRQREKSMSSELKKARENARENIERLQAAQKLISTMSDGVEKHQSQQQQQHLEDDESMIAILKAQRDRFRQRVSTLESKYEVLKRSESKCKLQSKELKQDNVKLYEKIRFLQQYRSSSSSSSSSGKNNNSNDLESGKSMDKYRKAYKEQSDPFAEFRKRMMNRSYKNLSAADRITLTGSKIFLTNKYTRMILFLYAIILHLLISYTLLSHVHSCDSSGAHVIPHPSIPRGRVNHA
jgi:homeobox protein cut-like